MTEREDLDNQTTERVPEQDEDIDKSVADMVAEADTGAREPGNPFFAWVITLLCLSWSGFQLWLAYMPINSHIARSWHLGFAICLAFLAYPAYKESKLPKWVLLIRKIIPFFGSRSVRSRIPIYDIILAVVATAGALYIWWDYDQIIQRMGLPTQLDIWMGIILIVLLLEAARRCLGPALAILASLFLLYTVIGPYLPELLRHRGVPLDFIISDMYLTTTGIFGVPLGVSTDFVFLFVLFGALLDRAGGGKYFIDVAFSALGTFRGGPAKAAVLASGLTGLVSGSSIANTVTTGTFTIPLMKKVGFPGQKAAAIEVASSVNGQLMPPVMGAAAFIMAEIIGIPYLDVVRAALFPALISYLALLYIVHIEAMKMGIEAMSRQDLPKFGATLLRGCHFIIPLAVLLFYLVVLRRSPVAAALFAIESLLVIMILQRPIIAFLSLGMHKRAGTLDPNINVSRFLGAACWLGLQDIWNGLIMGARNMITVGVAVATAGIIVGVVAITGLVGRFITIIATLSMGNIVLMLIFTAVTSLILGMGLPTTANYIIMATLTAPVIITLGGDAGLVFPLIAAHLFVFYFGILADVTPPVGLAAYAGAAIARSDPIATGVQGFAYSMRTALLPFIFLFNLDLLMIAGVGPEGKVIWLNDPIHLAWVFFSGTIAMFAFASALQGWLVTRCNWLERFYLLVITATTFRPGVFAAYLPFERLGMQILGVCMFFALFAWQMVRSRMAKKASTL